MDPEKAVVMMESSDKENIGSGREKDVVLKTDSLQDGKTADEAVFKKPKDPEPAIEKTTPAEDSQIENNSDEVIFKKPDDPEDPIGEQNPEEGSQNTPGIDNIQADMAQAPHEPVAENNQNVVDEFGPHGEPFDPGFLASKRELIEKMCALYQPEARENLKDHLLELVKNGNEEARVEFPDGATAPIEPAVRTLIDQLFFSLATNLEEFAGKANNLTQFFYFFYLRTSTMSLDLGRSLATSFLISKISDFEKVLSEGRSESAAYKLTKYRKKLQSLTAQDVSYICFLHKYHKNGLFEIFERFLFV